MSRGENKLAETLDIVTLLEAQRSIRMLKKLMLSPNQLFLAKLGCQNYLSPNETENKSSDEKNIEALVGYPISKELDILLLDNISGEGRSRID